MRVLLRRLFYWKWNCKWTDWKLLRLRLCI